MKFASAVAILALASVASAVPAVAAKDDKLPRCNARQKRPANLYGSVLPTIPDRGMTAATASADNGGVPRGTPALQPAPVRPSPTTDLFPPAAATPAPQGAASPNATVPAIGPVVGQVSPSAALSTSYASC